MIYNSKEEALKSREKSIEISDDEWRSGFSSHYKKWDFLKTNMYPTKMGQLFLYEKCLSSDKITTINYPKLGVYLNALPCDQTIEVEWVDWRRTCEYNIEYFTKNSNGDEFEVLLAENDTQIQRLPLWWDGILVYGVWDSFPTWTDLRRSYEMTWWFHRPINEVRNIKLDRIFNENISKI